MENKFWKIKNVTNKPVNFVCAMPNSGSKGILLQPGECVVVHSLGIKTSTLGVQERRKLVEIQENFNNDLYKFNTYENLKDSEVVDKANFMDAEKAAEGYITS
jgi:hypothetical protein